MAIKMGDLLHVMFINPNDYPDGTWLRCHPRHQAALMVFDNGDVLAGEDPENYQVGSTRPCKDCGKSEIYKPHISPMISEKEDIVVPVGIFLPSCSCRENKRKEQERKERAIITDRHFRKEVQARKTKILSDQKKESWEHRVRNAANEEMGQYEEQEHF